MCGWAARANRQSRVNKPDQTPRPEAPIRLRPLPPGFARIGRNGVSPVEVIANLMADVPAPQPDLLPASDVPPVPLVVPAEAPAD
jgi:hypothetical protein